MAYAYISGHITHMPMEWLNIYEKIAKIGLSQSGLARMIRYSSEDEALLKLKLLLEKEFGHIANGA